MNLDLDRLSASNRRLGVLAVVGVLVLAAMPLVTTDYVAEILMTGMVFVILGVSWNLLAGYAGQISLGHAAFFGIGAYVTAWLTTPTNAGLPAAIALPVPIAVFAGGLLAALVALVIGPIMFRLRGHYFAIGTLALAAILQLVLLDQRTVSGGSSGYYVDASLGELPTYLLTLVATIVTVVVVYYVVESRLGLGMQAIHGDEEAASGLGVNPLKYKLYAFVISSFFAGLAGAVYANYTLYINPESTLSVTWTISTLVIVVLGGMGTFAGPILGAVLFLGLDNLLGAIVGELSTSVEGLLIIAFIIFLPAGLYGLLNDRLLGDRNQPAHLTETPDDQQT